MNTNKMTRLSVIACATSIFCLGAGAGFAGEVDGKGNPIPGGDKGRSECSFSGQQDDPVEDEGAFRGDRTQSWGQLPNAVRQFLKSIGFTPGSKIGLPDLGSCNPNHE